MVKLPATSPFPESVTVSPDGTLYVSSMTNGGIARAEPGATNAEQWIEPGAFGTRSTFGVLADERTNTLWVCSNDASALGIAGPSAVKGAFVKEFDLKTGVGKASVELPPGPALCNDFAIGPYGAVYITNTAAPQVLRLRPKTGRIEVWLTDPRLKGGLDGIAFGEDSNLYVNTYVSGEFFRIAVRNGVAGDVTKLATSRALGHPDGLKPVKGGFLMVEGAGTLDHVVVKGSAAKVDTLAKFAGPTGVTTDGDRVWVSEGKLSLMSDPTLKKGGLPTFDVRQTSFLQR